MTLLLFLLQCYHCCRCWFVADVVVAVVDHADTGVSVIMAAAASVKTVFDGDTVIDEDTVVAADTVIVIFGDIHIMFVYIIIVPNVVAVVSVPSVIAHHVVGGGYACGISILLQSILLLFCCCHYQLLLLLLLLFLVVFITLVVASHTYFVVVLAGTSMLFVRHPTCMLFCCCWYRCAINVIATFVTPIVDIPPLTYQYTFVACAVVVVVFVAIVYSGITFHVASVAAKMQITLLSYTAYTSHRAHDVVATLNQRQRRWFNVATTSCAQWDADVSDVAVAAAVDVAGVFWHILDATLMQVVQMLLLMLLFLFSLRCKNCCLLLLQLLVIILFY